MAIEFGFKFLGLSEDGRRDQEEVLRLILPEIRRCRALHIVSEDNAGMDDFRDAVEEMETPVLESFTLSLDRCYERKGWGNFDDNIEISEWDASAFWEAPLTSLRMDGTGLRYLGPPLDCIRDLRLEGLYSSDLTKFLEPCFQQILALPNLEVLSIVNINFQYPRPDVESVPTLVEAKSLKHFRYRRHVRHDEIGCWFLTVVVAPLLETLTLDDFEVYGIPFRLSPTDRFPSLHTLTLHNPLSVTVLNPTLDETYPFRGFMSCTQHIKHLLVSVAHPGRHVLQRQSDPCRLIDSIFLAEIVRHAESSPFWGKLETISLDVTTRDIADNLQKLVAVFPHSTRDLKIPERHLATDAARSLNTPKTMKISKLGDFEAIVPAHPWSHWPTMERDPFGRRPLAERIVSPSESRNATRTTFLMLAFSSSRRSANMGAAMHASSRESETMPEGRRTSLSSKGR